MTQVEKPLPDLRFVNRDGRFILQQRWEITSYYNYIIDTQAYEWRDVPLEEE